MNERAVADLEELAREDAALADGAAQIRDLDARIGTLRMRAEAIAAFFAAHPVEESRVREAVHAAADELARRHEELAEAERSLAAAHDHESRERALSAVTRGRDHVDVADAALARARAAASELERDAAALPEEVAALEERARSLSAESKHVPAAPTGLGELVEWASHAHAELFVAVRQVEAQRERVVREANELASMLLGEATYGSTVEQALARVSRARA